MVMFFWGSLELLLKTMSSLVHTWKNHQSFLLMLRKKHAKLLNIPDS